MLLPSACAPGRSEASSASPSVSRDPRRCALPGMEALPADSAAIRCAEWFVARNGYTDVSVTDTLLLALESIEVAKPAAERIRGRAHSLAPRAALVCPGGKSGRGWTVGFLAPGDSVGEQGRAVTMSGTFTDLRVEHVTFLPRAALQRDDRCRALGILAQK